MRSQIKPVITVIGTWKCPEAVPQFNTHRIHGAGIYANIGGILMVNVTILAYMDPMG